MPLGRGQGLGTRFVWLCNIARTGVLEDASSMYSEAGEGTLLGVKSGR